MTFEELLAAIATAVAAARTAGEQYRQQVANRSTEILRDQSLTDDVRTHLLARLREELRPAAMATVMDRRSAAIEARRQMRELIDAEETAARSTGPDAVTAALSRDRVRELIDRGVNPWNIVESAARSADRDTLEALRTEIVWLAVEQGAVAGGFGESIRKAMGADDPSAQQAAGIGLRRQLDRELIPLLRADRPNLADARQAELDLEARWPEAQVWLDDAVTNLDSGPSLGTAIAAQAVAPAEEVVA